jgi:hypothetical protein
MKIKKEDELILVIIRKYFHNELFKYDDFDLANINWNELLKISLRHNLFLVIYKCISKFIPVEYQALYKKQYYLLIMVLKIYMRELKAINLSAEQNKIKVILLKGFSLSKMIYDDLYIRSFSDIDFLLDEKDIKNMYRLVNKIGYEQDGGFDEEQSKMITINTDEFLNTTWFHELQCKKKIRESLYVSVEIKRASSAIPLENVTDFLNNTQILDLSEMKILSTDIMYSLLHLIANFYNNTETIYGALFVTLLRDSLDIAMFIKKYHSAIDWDRLFELSLKYQITHKVYFVINCIIETFKYQIIDTEIINKFLPIHLPYLYTDNYDGSYFSWETDYFTRLFDDDLRKKEALKLYKNIIYSITNDSIIDDAQKDSFKVVANIKYFKCFYIKSINKQINYLFTNNNKYLNLYIMIDEDIIEEYCDHYVEVHFIDNFIGNYDHTEILISISQNPVINFFRIEDCQWYSINFGDRVLIKIIIPLAILSMDFEASHNLLNYNFNFSKKNTNKKRTILNFLSENKNFIRLSFIDQAKVSRNNIL